MPCALMIEKEEIETQTISQKECEKNHDWICKIFDENIDEKTIHSA